MCENEYKFIYVRKYTYIHTDRQTDILIPVVLGAIFAAWLQD